MKVVSDSGPILSFARAGRLDILRQLFGEIIIPEAVFTEITIGGKGKPGSAEVESRAWIKRQQVGDRSMVNQLSAKIKPVLDALITAGTYISESLYQEFLRTSGEP